MWKKSWSDALQASMWCKDRSGQSRSNGQHHGALINCQLGLGYPDQVVRNSDSYKCLPTHAPSRNSPNQIVNIWVIARCRNGPKQFVKSEWLYSTRCGRQEHWFTPPLLKEEPLAPHPDPHQDLLLEGFRSGTWQPACQASKECPEWLGQSSVMLAGFHHSTEGLGSSLACQTHTLFGSQNGCMKQSI